MSKKTIAVVFGGQSSEHEVSCKSGATIISNINKDNYDVIIIGITKEGKWLLVNSVDDITSGEWKKSKIGAIISPDATIGGVILTSQGKVEVRKVDVVFPVLHGLYGEDGTIQGLLELSKIPYVGCGVLASAISMDKFYTKVIVDRIGVPQAKYVEVYKRELTKIEGQISRIEEAFAYPVFVKPSNAGSSQGVSKATNRVELEKALRVASEHDKKILVEETIIGREVECAVLGGYEVKASGVGEILAAADFYDYDAKYNNAESKTVVNADLPQATIDLIRDYSVRIFKAVDGFGLARVDFFVDKVTGKVIFNEINTLPGFTSISMYPMLWEAKGLGKSQLVDKLIQLAYARANEGEDR